MAPITKRNRMETATDSSTAECQQVLVNPEVKQKFETLFAKGHSAASAMKLHKHDLQMEYDEEDYFKIINDQSIYPHMEWCSALQLAILNGQSNGGDESMALRLKQLINVYNKKCGAVSILGVIFNQDDYCIAIVTPLMRRNHQLNPRSAEIVYVLSSGKMVRNPTKVFQILTDTDAGGIPLGLLLVRSDSENCLTQALKLYKNLAGDSGHFGRGSKGPLIWVGDNCSDMERAWEVNFPDSFHVISVCDIMRMVWKRFSYGKEKIPQHDRQIIMVYLKCFVLSKSENDLNYSFSEFKKNRTVKKYKTLVSFVGDLYVRRKHWVLYNRARLAGCFQKKTIFETFLNATMDVVVDKVKLLNVIQTCSFIFDRLEKYYEERLLTIKCGNLDKFVWIRHVIGDRLITKDQVLPISSTVFLVVNNESVENEILYEVDTSIGVCECSEGIMGIPCQHQYAVWKWFEITIFGSCHVIESGKQLLVSIAKSAENSELILGQCEHLLDMSCENEEDSSDSTVPLMDNEKSDGMVGIVDRGLVKFARDLKFKCLIDPDVYVPAVVAFLKTYDGIKDDAGFPAALNSFGMVSSRECSLKITRQMVPLVSVPVRIVYHVKQREFK